MNEEEFMELIDQADPAACELDVFDELAAVVPNEFWAGWLAGHRAAREAAATRDGRPF